MDANLLILAFLLRIGKAIKEAVMAMYGPELAPAITEANWDTSGAGWVHPVVGGVLDKGSAGTDGAGPIVNVIEADAIYEITFTAVNSPTTGTFVDDAARFVFEDTDSYAFLFQAIGTYTFTIHTLTDTNYYIYSGNAARFGISAISVKKLIWPSRADTLGGGSL